MSALEITGVRAWEALDSRGRPTVAARVDLAGGGRGRVVVPSGASTGRHEAVELRDGGSRYAGKGVRAAVGAVNDVLGPRVSGMDAADRWAVDAVLEEVDGRDDLSRLGSNAALAVSLSVIVAAADGRREPLWRFLGGERPALLPMPMVNILSGGAHADGAIDLQDVLVVPLAAPTFADAIEWVDRVRRASARMLEEHGGWSALVADEGGLAARLPSNESGLALVARAVESAGFALGEEVALAVDVAASELLDTDGRLRLTADDARLDASAWLEQIATWRERYGVVSVEDPFGEDDWDSWSVARRRMDGTQLLGDDLFATHLARLERGIADDAATAVLVKVNQAGTVSRAEGVLRRAHEVGLATVVSARSGDTEDTWLADLAVGWHAGQIKVGSLMRSERTSKWNRLLELEADGGTELARFPTPSPGTGVPRQPA